MNKLFNLIIAICILTVIFIFKDYSYNFKNLLLDKSIYLTFFGFFMVSNIFISIRWWLLSNAVLKEKTSLTYSLSITLAAYAYNVTVLGGVGDLSKFYYFKSENKAKIVGLILVERVCGLIASLGLSLFVIINFFNYNISIIYLLLYLCLVVFLINKKLLIKYIPYLNISEYEISKIINNSKIYLIIFISLLLQFIFYIGHYFLIKMFGINISYKELILILALLSIANSIPLSYSGFGIREIFVLLFSNFILIDISDIFDFTITLGFLNLCLGAILLLFYKFVRKY